MAARRFAVQHGESRVVAEITGDGQVKLDGDPAVYRIVSAPGGGIRVDDGARTWEVFASGRGDTRQAFCNGEVWELHVAAEGTRAPRTAGHGDGLTAPMPATLTRLLVKEGDEVHRGDILMKLEAMKMELPVRAPRDGRIKAIRYREGDLVEPDVALVEME